MLLLKGYPHGTILLAVMASRTLVETIEALLRRKLGRLHFRSDSNMDLRNRRHKTYFINTDAKSNNGISYHDAWIARGLAVTSGEEKYKSTLEVINRGDTLLLWANKIGVVAIGTMLDDEPTTVIAGRDEGTISPTEEWEFHRRVAWNDDLRRHPISSKEVKAYRGQNPLSTIATLKEGREQILDLVRARVQESDVAELAERKGETDPEKLFVLTEARRGQGKYRGEMLALWGGRCAVTGCTMLPVIRASHAKAWRDSSDRERLDPNNGLPLTANLDALFDRGLIGFDDAGQMLLSHELSDVNLDLLNLPMPLCQRPSETQAYYLSDHRVRYALE
jgi:putative restriction endonuclease